MSGFHGGHNSSSGSGFHGGHSSPGGNSSSGGGSYSSDDFSYENGSGEGSVNAVFLFDMVFSLLLFFFDILNYFGVFILPTFVSAFVSFFVSAFVLFVIFFKSNLNKAFFRIKLDIEKDRDTFEEITRGKYVNRIGTRCLKIIGMRCIILDTILLILFIKEGTLVNVFHSIGIAVGIVSLVLGISARKGFIRSITYVGDLNGDFYISEEDVALYVKKQQEEQEEQEEIEIPKKRVYKATYCKYCGRKLIDGAMECKKCGAKKGKNY